MSATTTSLRFSRWQRLTWPRPEWWSLGLCLGAWLLILTNAGASATGGHASHEHVHHVAATAAPMAIHASWPAQTFWWLVMVIAMMFPLLVDHIRNTAARSLWYRRHRAVGLFLTGYVAPWLVFGIAASAMLSVLEAQSRLDPPLLSALGFGLALIWQVTPARRRAVLSCHRTRPISPTGWRADRDCLRYGSSVGASCLFSCWALMLACMLSRHSVPAMFAITAIGLFERNRARPNQRLLCAVIAALGFTYAIGPYL